MVVRRSHYISSSEWGISCRVTGLPWPLKHIFLPAIWRHVAPPHNEFAHRLTKSLPGQLVEEGRV